MSAGNHRRAYRRSVYAAAALGLLLPACGPFAACRQNSASAAAPWPPVAPVAHDRFGGETPAIAPATGYFHIAKLDRRWVLISPKGGALWLRAVYGVDWSGGGRAAAQALARKYGKQPAVFARHAAERLRAWGFNALGSYESAYVLPVPTYYRQSGNPVQLPFIRSLNLSWYGAIDQDHLAPAPFKTLLAGAVDPAVYRGWPGNIPDVFDPNFAAYAKASAADLATRAHRKIFTGGLAQSPWLIGTIGDDSDDVYGLGPGSAMPGTRGTIHPNIAWVVAVTKPYQRENTQVGAARGIARTIHYADPTVYGKQAWESYLRNKYHTVQALNRAWGSDYTTFGSDGGWPNGRGVLDESGRHAWIGSDGFRLQGAAPAVKRDLNAFLQIYADRYYRVTSAAVRAASPHQLVFSGVLDSWSGLTRAPILRAAARYCDVLQVSVDAGDAAVLDRTYALAHKPLMVWYEIRADRDSALRQWNSAGGARTQQSRGRDYARQLAWLFAYRAPDGVRPIIGIDFWEYMDKPGERANFGLVTPSDNAYDGKQDTVRPGVDRWGFPTGGEVANFGDFLSAVTHTNRELSRRLFEALAREQARAGELRRQMAERNSGSNVTAPGHTKP